MDFTLKIAVHVLRELKAAGYTFRSVADYLENPANNSVILRHDVDRLPQNSLSMAKREAEKGIKGTYYFRITPSVYQVEMIKAIANMGHEIGYHYEDFTSTKGDWELAILSFEKNLEKLRTIFPVKTICMHGSPLSKFDNRMLWQKYNYRDYGIIGEPYLDVDFNEVFNRKGNF